MKWKPKYYETKKKKVWLISLNDRGEVLYKDNVMVEFETEKEAEEFIIGKMEAGRELDCEIDEKIFGNTWTHIAPDMTWDDIPHYSTDIAAAWRVVEKMKERQGRDRLIINVATFWGNHSWIYKCELLVEQRRLNWVGIADTAPLAICRAALKAVMND